MRTTKRSLIADQTLEPTQVAGFNQFFDDPEGTDAWRYGLGLDRRLAETVTGGLELSRRELNVRLKQTAASYREGGWTEAAARAYVYWTPRPRWAFSGQYRFEAFDRDANNPGQELVKTSRTHHVPLSARYFHPSGWSVGITAAYVAQEGDFVHWLSGDVMPGSDRFWVFDAALRYRLPKRHGTVSIEVKNALDEEFFFQDTDPKNPQIQPGRLILGKFTLSF
jgi:hypothetical protein